MKKFSLLFLGIIIIMFVVADEWKNIQSPKPAPAKITLLSSNIETSVFKVELDGFFINTVKTNEGIKNVIAVGEGTPILEKDSPDLNKLATSIIIPDLAEMSIKIVSSSFKDFENIEVAPSKGNLTRDINPSKVPYEYGNVYQTNAFYPEKLIELRDPHIVRDYRGQTVLIYPFQYNPVSKTLRVYYEMTVEVYQTNNNGINPLVKTKAFDKVDAEFNNIYASHFINKNEIKYTPVEEQGKMLVISYGSFMSDMQSYVDWKNTIGIPTEIVDVASIGNSTAIKTYIADYYNTNGLTYVLLVGDAAQVPSSYSSGDSDNDYSYIVGADHYPDIFVGRFSAENASHVQTMVQRTIDYEQNPTTSYDWYTRSVGIASQEGTGDDNEYDYEHMRNMQTDLLGYNYTSVAELFEGDQGGNDATGNPTATMVGNEINNGSGLILYTGHGSNTTFVTSGFSNTDVDNLTNNGMLPFIWSVACVNGNFVSTTCFAEAWLRATNNDEPSGAIATLMSTINQSWNPPMEGQDEMVDILVESYTSNIKRTFGGISMNGCMQMNDTYGSAGDEMTDTWNCFGDPSLVVRTAVPQNLTVSHNAAVLLGANQFTVNCTTEGALVCMSIDNQIIGTGIINGGNVAITFDPLTTVGTVTIAVTAYNYIPYLADVDVVPASGPYVNFTAYQINDVTGNNNGDADFNEDITLNISLENIGSSPANNVSAILSTVNSYANITDNTQFWGTIADGTTSTQTDAFAISIADDVPDQHLLSFELEITDGSEIWNSTIQFTVQAPLLIFGDISIDDNAGGDGNGRLDPGETANITFPILNNGHSDAPVATAILSSLSSYLTINNNSSSLGVITAGSNNDALFNISCDLLTPVGTPVDLTVNVDAGNYGILNTFYETVGLVLEDWETGNFISFPWEFAGIADWTITNVDPYEGTYCVKSGIITHSQTTELVLNVETTNDDNISFFRKVSSESSYDYLRFYIDGTQQEQWSGEMAWEQVSFFVSAGMHEFKWEYMKDGSVSGGDDCCWIDFIILPSIVPPADPADINLNAYSFEVNLSTDELYTEILNIANLGEDDLNFSLSKNYQSKNNKAYCTSSGGGTDEFIQNVSIGTINNTTIQSNYADYTSLSTIVNVGESYPISITNGDPNWSTDQCGIWVDWNQNEDFSDEDPILVSGTPGVGPYTATITPPLDALPGLARMRVQIIYSATPDPCASFSYGEVEDYSLNVNSNFVDWLTIDPMAGSILGGNDTNIGFNFNSTGLDEGDYIVDVTLTSNDPDEAQIIIPCTLHVINEASLNLTALLQGPFDAGEMNTTLNQLGHLPITHPFNTSPWNYSGIEAVVSIPIPDIVDWVLLEFRDAPGDALTATESTLLEFQPVFILKDGSILGLDGVSYPTLKNQVINNLFVIIHHRNHIPIMSANPISLSGNIYEYDFTSSVTTVFGGIDCSVEVAPGIWGMVAGDGLCDGIINENDEAVIWESEAGNTGYHSGDFDMNSEVDNVDKNSYWESNIGKNKHIPN